MIRAMSAAVLAAAFCVSAQAPAAPAAKPTISPVGSINIQAQKWFYDDGIKNNFDQLWGRANFGGVLNGDWYTAKIVMRVYPAGFGYEVLSGVELKNDSTLSSKTSAIAKIQLPDAWAMAKTPIGEIKVGAFDIGNYDGESYGNYTDDNVINNGGSWKSRVPTGNALELKKTLGPSTTQIDLLVMGSNLNKGDLRVFESINPVKPLTIGAGYRSNVFDRVQDSAAVITHRISGQLAFAPRSDLKAYAEVGVLGLRSDKSKVNQQVPVMFGLVFPTAKILDKALVEFELLNANKRPNGEALVFNVYMMKKFGTYYKAEWGVFSQRGAGEAGMALRLSASL